MSAPNPSKHPLDKQTEHRLGPYRLIRPISAGGMARVYEGRLDSLAGVSTRVAIKVIHPEHATDKAFQDLFISEARVSARLDHQNLVRVQQFSREGELYYLVMELIDGLTLRKIISLCRRHHLQLPVTIIAELGRQVCEGLEYAHNLRDENGEPLNLVHRDLKPSNLMLTTQGVVKLLDFGISYTREPVGAPSQENTGWSLLSNKSTPPKPPRSQGIKGTWGYMALEQVEGRRVGPPADVYGLASVLFEMATLEPLFDEKDNDRLKGRMLEDEAARRAAGIAQTELGPILVRALQRDPAARYASASAFGRALARLIANPVTIRDDLVQLGQSFRTLDTQTAAQPSAPAAGANQTNQTVSRLRSLSSIPPTAGLMDVQNLLGPRTNGGPNTGSSTGPVLLRPEDRLRAMTGSHASVGADSVRTDQPSWLALVGVGMVMSLIGGGIAAYLINQLDSHTNSGSLISPLENQSLENQVNPLATPVPDQPILSEPTPDLVAEPGEGSPSGPSEQDTVVPGSGAPEDTTPGKTTPPSNATPRTSPTPKPKPTPAPKATPQVILVSPKATPTPVVQASQASGEAYLTISAFPRAQVYINGIAVRYTPVFDRPMAPGSYDIELRTDDGRSKRFTVKLQSGEHLRKIWSFLDNSWQ